MIRIIIFITSNHQISYAYTNAYTFCVPQFAGKNRFRNNTMGQAKEERKKCFAQNYQGKDYDAADPAATSDLDTGSSVLSKIDSISLIIFPITFAIFLAIYLALLT